ncbi:MAG: endonuclease III, partial [Nitrospinae bacterium]|nr:endonuclease III [Nitrospinota bacterium]
PVVSKYADDIRPRSAFHVLISCLLSLRTKDSATALASKRLFEMADDPQTLASASVEKIEKLIYPVGFYRNKAHTVVEISRTLVEKYGGHVPSDIDELLLLRGVGRKTANLVVTEGFGLPGICVDTHVHRICNIWGYVHTRTPEETEYALRKRLPARYWITFNKLLVTFGQNHCKPVSPLCSTCSILEMCPGIGLKKWR